MSQEVSLAMHPDLAQYFDSIPAHRKERLLTLHSLIVRLFPQAQVDLKYKMPTYHLDEGWVAIANQKNYVSVYTCGYHHIESFNTQFPSIKTGKGCINFKDTDTLPLQELQVVVKHAISHPKS